MNANTRFVAKSFDQEEELDYFDTFTPTLCTSSIRLVVAVTLENDVDLRNFDTEQWFV